MIESEENINSKKDILIITLNDLTYDVRLKRQIEIFKEFATNVGLVCLRAEGKIEGVEVVELGASPRNIAGKVNKAARLISGLYLGIEIFLNNFQRHKLDKSADDVLEELTFEPNIIIANEPISIPLSLNIRKVIKKDVPILVDLYEYYYDLYKDFFYKNFLQKYNTYILDKYLKEAKTIITVSNKLAEAYEKMFGLQTFVFYNVPFYYDLKPLKPRSVIKLVHHGGAKRVRKLEKLIELMHKLNKDYELHLYLIPIERDYLNELEENSGKLLNKRIFFHPPITPSEKIPEVINQYDIGITMFEKTTKNIEFALPNKFFEFIQGRLMNLSTPYSREVEETIKEYDLGIVTRTFDVNETAEILNNLTPEQIMKYKENADRAAKIFHAGNEEKKLKKLIEEVVKNRKK